MGWLDDAEKIINKKKEADKTSSSALFDDPDFFKKLLLRFPNVSEDKLKNALARARTELITYDLDEKDVYAFLDKLFVD